MTYADLASGASKILAPAEHQPGLTAPFSSTEAKAAVVRAKVSGLDAVLEAALWVLADWDGMGAARARQTASTAGDPVVRGFAELLAGGIGRARRAFTDEAALNNFARAVGAAWDRDSSLDESLHTAAAIRSLGGAT